MTRAFREVDTVCGAGSRAARSQSWHEQRHERVIAWLAFGWVCAISLSLAIAITHAWRQATEFARIEARASFEKDLLLRRWATLHGGVYVPPSQKSPANPYLSVPEKDVLTTRGAVLTLVNPAYMLRQLHELEQERTTTRSHITSLNPLRPGNAADAWELETLKSFEKGTQENSAITDIAGVTYLRYMRPMITEAGCMKCHEGQGYKVGQIRGGISVSVPMAPFRNVMWSSIRQQIIAHTLLAAIGLVVLEAGRRHLCRLWSVQMETEQALRESEATFATAFQSAPVLICISDADTGRILEVNDQFSRATGFSRDDVSGRTLEDIGWRSASQGYVVDAAGTEIAFSGKDGKTLTGLIQQRILSLGKRKCVLSVTLDVTERVLAAEALRRDDARFRSLALILQHRGESTHEFLDFALNEVLRCTGSKLGYFYFYSEAKQEFILNSWSGEVMKNCALPPTPQRYELVKTGIWGEAVRQRRPILLNDFEKAHPLKKGYPDGHVSLQRFLTVPVFSGKEIVAVVGVANKESDYIGSDIEQLQLLMDAVWRVVEQRQAVEALRASEERYRGLVETSFDWIWETDAHGKYTYSSQRGCDLLGISMAELLGRTPGDMMAPGDVQQRATYDELVAGRRPFRLIENVYVHRDGHSVTLETSGEPVFGLDGEWLGYRGTSRDVTARRTVEESLRLRNAALSAAANAVVITDREGAVEWANQAFTTLSGWSFEEVVGRNSKELIKSGAHGPEFYEKMWTTILAGEVWRGEVINRRKDGTNWTEEMTITPLKNEAGDVEHFIAIKQDITERKAIEAQLLQAQRMEAIGTLAGGIAHDLNNILSPMLMVSGLVKERLSTAEDRDLLEMLERSAERGGEIIRQLLVYSRGLDGPKRVIQPRYVLKEMVTIMRETFPRGITIATDIAQDLAPITADQTQLHQIVMNLCVNARDAMPQGGNLTICAANTVVRDPLPALPAAVKPGSYVRMEVIDSGTGIPPELMGRIFDPFFTTKPVGKGTGLGLATVLGLVQKHDGYLAVDSSPGIGSTFRIYIPAAPSAPRNEPVAAESSLPRGNGELILVVDDEHNIRETTRIMLKKQGYRVKSAMNGKDGLVSYFNSQDEVRLLITDIMMPEMNGIALIEAMRESNPRLPIIAMSGLGEMDNEASLNALRVAETLVKPFSGAVLLHAVHRLLHASVSEDAHE